MAVQTTFQSMGLRSAKAVTTHLLLENAYESNLLSDIAQVDYLAGNLGRSHLRPRSGLQTFVDDVYVYGYLRREDCVVHRGRLSCITGNGGAAKNIVSRISTAVRESMGAATGYIQTSIVHTVAARCASAAAGTTTAASAIRKTIARIEFDTAQRAPDELARAV
ncbi:MAG: hypothetical protein AB2556_24265 [Candidatus Thiodiazotropha sp.]